MSQFKSALTVEKETPPTSTGSLQTVKKQWISNPFLSLKNLNKKSSTKKLVHLVCNGVLETIEITETTPVSDIMSVLYDCAQVRPDPLISLKLYTIDNIGVPIDSAIEPNTIGTRYTLKVVRDPESLYLEINSIIKSASLQQMVTLNHDLEKLKQSAENMKKQVAIHLIPLTQIKRPSKPLHPSYSVTKRYKFSNQILDALKTPYFDNWQFDEYEMIELLECMFEDLGLMKEFSIDPYTLTRFLQHVRDHYKPNFFHNFRHCFCVTQMMYTLLYCSGLIETLKPVEKLILIVACIGHDLDHPGFNNAYQINAKTDYALMYNDSAPLEMHHSAMLFTILKFKDGNIFSNISDSMYREIRKGIVLCILATDMAKHGEIIGTFKKASETFSYNDTEHRLLLLQMIIKCSDISNEVRPNDVSDPWVDALLQEFFSQSDREKAEGLPTAPFMDRDKVTKAGAQVGFIGFVMVPLYETLAKVLPGIDEPIVTPIRKALEYYKELQKKSAPK